MYQIKMDQEISKILEEKAEKQATIKLLSIELEQYKLNQNAKIEKKGKLNERLSLVEKDSSQIPKIIEKVVEIIKH